MDFQALIHILAGSSVGLVFRLFIFNKFTKKIGNNINNVSLVNILASLFLGIVVALKPLNNNLFFFLYVGFLGCFSTFSSFIYQLLNLFQSRQFVRLFFHYIEILILSFMFFCLGYFIVLSF